jgi:hypothetical protein
MTTASVSPNYDRVTQGMRILQEALGPFVHRELSRVYGGKWYTEGVLRSVSDMTRRQLSTSGVNKELIDELDLAALLTVINKQWNDTFHVKLPRETRHYIDELVSTRNKWAHVSKGDMDEDDAWRALDTMARVLEMAKLPHAGDVSKLAKELREARYAAAQPAPAPVIKAPAAPPTGVAVEVPQAQPGPTQAAMDLALRPWREVITPHEDVAAGRYQQAEFAADLAQVLSGKAEPEYQDAAEFFARTYVTEGMTNLLTAALKRLGAREVSRWSSSRPPSAEARPTPCWRCITSYEARGSWTG